MARIEDKLVEAGARDIYKSYNSDRECDAIVFVMPIPDNPLPLHFKLPARVDACYEALWKMYRESVKRPSDAMKKTLREQSLRTAWKIIHDWVEIQISMIQLEQAEAMQIFLPYVYNPESKETFYEHVKKGQYKLLSNG